MTVVLALAAGGLIGLSLGALGSGGSILAVPVLAYLLGQTPAQATTGSLVVVGVTALTGAVASYRAGHVLLGRGVGFGLVAVAGAALGAHASTLVDPAVLVACFSALMAAVGVLMTVRLVRADDRGNEAASVPVPLISLRPVPRCACRQAALVALTATGVGVLTGFLGVGGGFLVVPALVGVLALPLKDAAGTSLVVITLTSAAALAVRIGSGVSPDWVLVALLTLAAGLGGLAGARWGSRVDARVLSTAFTVVVLAVAAGTAAHTLPALV